VSAASCHCLSTRTAWPTNAALPSSARISGRQWMTKNKSAPILVDLEQFESVAPAKSVIRRFHGFDDCVKQELTSVIEGSGGVTTDLMFVLSAISRSRALHEAIVREIEHDNPQAVFMLMRQFAETVALIRYTADHPRYFDTASRTRRILSRE
jgi:hypothetical protein